MNGQQLYDICQLLAVELGIQKCTYDWTQLDADAQKFYSELATRLNGPLQGELRREVLHWQALYFQAQTLCRDWQECACEGVYLEEWQGKREELQKRTTDLVG